MKFGPGYGSFGSADGYGDTPSGYGGTAAVKSHTGQMISPAPSHDMGQTLAPVAMTDTGYQNAAQAGPGMMPSTQWAAQHMAQVPSPHQPGVDWQVPHQQHPQMQMQTYGAPQVYAGMPTIVFAWQGQSGWVYKLLDTDVILASGSHSGQTYQDKALTPGTEAHRAVVDEWVKFNPQSLALPIGKKMLALREPPGLLSQMTSAVRDAISTVSGGAVAPSTPPASSASTSPAPSSTAMVPQGAGYVPPAPSSSNRGLMIAGGVLVVLGVAAGAWWVFGSKVKKNPDEGSASGTDSAKAN